MDSQQQRNPKQDNQHSESIPTFLSKTFEILEVSMHKSKHKLESRIQRYYQLDQKRRGFRCQTSQRVLRQNPSSALQAQQLLFIRQTGIEPLNMYDFHKMRQDNQENAFKNTLFKRGCRHLLKQIQRKDYKKNKQLRVQINTSHTINNKSQANFPHSTIQKEIALEADASGRFYSKSLNTCNTTLLNIQEQLEDVQTLEKLVVNQLYQSQQTNKQNMLSFELMELLFKLKRGNNLVRGQMQNLCNDWSSFLPKKFIKYDSLLFSRGSSGSKQEEGVVFEDLRFPNWAHTLVSFPSFNTSFANVL